MHEKDVFVPADGLWPPLRKKADRPERSDRVKNNEVDAEGLCCPRIGTRKKKNK